MTGSFSSYPLVKICGLRRVEDLEAVRAAGADLAGLVFAPSRRQIEPDAAKALLRAVPGHPPAVGVFVNAEVELMDGVAEEVGLEYVQLGGEESPPEGLKTPYIKTVHLRPGADAQSLLHIMNWHRDAVAFLLDTWSPQGGGSGIVGDWAIVEEVVRQSAKVVWLAGGLHSQNVQAGLRETGAAGVDVSSGVERDGWKDPSLIQEFVASAKGAKRC